ncbi:MAG: four helix bundle protein [Saprospiraceae bacterium]|nr:four helix bundle protein [Saprospiraceae bacterium]
MIHRSFTDLDVYKECRQLRIAISGLVKSDFPTEEKFRLMDQILRSSRSITANIAEGHGRFYHKENISFCRKARGSMEETLEHLITAFDEGYITAGVLKTFKVKIDSCSKLINGYIKYLKKAQHGEEESD